MDKYSCSKCEDCIKIQSSEISRQAGERVLLLQREFKILLSERKNDYNNAIYLHADLLQFAVISFYEDIYRFVDYSGSELPDRHKLAAYIIKWLVKVKPIQIKSGFNGDKINEHILDVNYIFAVLVGFNFLGEWVCTLDHIPLNYIEYLLYSLKFRNISGRILAGELYILEHYCSICEKSKQ